MRTLVLALMLPVAALGAETLQIRHLPLGEAVAGEPLAVTAEVTNAHRLALFALHFRHQGEHWQTAEFRKDEYGGWAAIIGAKDVKPPALEYYLSAQEQGGKEVDRFASEMSPHPVLVRMPLDDAQHAERLFVQRVDLDARVVADRRQPRGRQRPFGLEPRVLRVRLPHLVHLMVVGHELEPGARKQFAILSQLARVASRDDEPLALFSQARRWHASGERSAP